MKPMFSEILNTRLGPLKGLSGMRDDVSLDNEDICLSAGNFGMGVPNIKDLMARAVKKETENTLRGAFRELGPIEQWPEPKTREPARGLCPPSIHLPKEPEV